MSDRTAHFRALDSLRGIAAFAVVLHHLFLAGAWRPDASWQWTLFRYTPLDTVIEGRQPVILFFVLSGFVLAHHIQTSAPPYTSFLVRRFARLYPPCAAAILLSALGYAALEPWAHRAGSAWLAGLWRNGHDLSRVAWHLGMTGIGRNDLDPALWSLVPEIRISAAMPLLVFLVRRRFGLTLAGAALLHLLALPFGMEPGAGGTCHGDFGCKPFWGGSLLGSLMVTLYFVVFFALGAGLALHRPALARRLARLPAPSRLLLLFAAALLLSAVPYSADLLFGLGAALLILLALEFGWLARLLTLQPLPWLGTISFSLYLIHVPLLLAVATVAPVLLTGGGVPVLVGLTLVVAWMFYRVVELPSRELGRLLVSPDAARASARA